MDDRTAVPEVEYGVTPTHVMASMSGLDFAQRRPPRRHRRGAHHRRKRPAARTCDDDVSGFRDSEGNVRR